MCVYAVDIGHTFRADSPSAPANLIPFRPCLSHPPAGTNGTTPCGVGNAMGPGPGVAPGSAQPRAVCHNAFGVGAGNREWTRIGDINWAGDDPLCAWKRRRTGHRRFPSGNPQGHTLPHPPPGIRRSCGTPSPIRESQRDCNCGDGRGPISPSGNAGGRAIVVSHSGNPKVARYPIPLRESQRDSAMKPGVAPPRRYPG